jgi:hypothetical protein
MLLFIFLSVFIFIDAEAESNGLSPVKKNEKTLNAV